MKKHFLLIFTLLFIPLAFGHAYASDTSDHQKLSGTIAVVNKSDNSVSLIDIGSKKIIAAMPTGKGPHELLVTNDGKTVISTDFVGGNSVSVFDISSAQKLRTIDLSEFPGPHGLRFLKTTGKQERVLVTSGPSKHLVQINIKTGKIEQSIATEQNTSHMLAVDESSKLAYVSNIRSNSISKIDLRNNKKLKDISVLAMPEAININESLGQLWYGANKTGKVQVLDLKDERILATFDDFLFPYRVLFNHDNNIAMVPDFTKHELRMFDTQTLLELEGVKLPKESGPQGIALHPTKDIAFLSLNLANKVLAIDIKSRKILAEYPTGNNPDGLGFSHLQVSNL